MHFSSAAIQNRKQNTAKALSAVMGSDDVVLVHCGHPIQKPGGHDQTYDFLPHPDYYWLTGHRREKGVAAFSKSEGWVEFVQPVTRDEKIWEGGGESLQGKALGDLEAWVGKRNVFHLGQTTTPAPLHVLEAFNEVRRIKDAEEIALITKVAHIAHAGYRHIKNYIKAGVSERQIQIEYEYEVLKAGSEKFPYGNIVGAGTNAAILHASPSARVVKEQDLVLIDAGADIADYCVDITRVFSASGKFTTQQQAIYDIVLAAQTKSIALCRPGVDWPEVHFASARTIAEGLRSLNILKCSVDQAIETSAISAFFPHGVGHMVGLRVRDVGAPPNPNPKQYAGARLRVDFPLKAGHLMTVEPGLYFIEALLNDEETRSKHKDAINWSEVPRWMDVGGVRIEDDIHVTEQGPVNLTAMVEK